MYNVYYVNFCVFENLDIYSINLPIIFCFTLLIILMGDKNE